MRLASFKHALLKEVVVVDLDLLAAWYHSAGTGGATHLVFTGGAMLPVAESVSEVSSAKTNVTPNTGEGAKKP